MSIQQYSCVIRRRISCTKLHRAVILVVAIIAISPKYTFAQTYNADMTLESASKLVMSKHPDLQVYRFRNLGFHEMAKMANQSPALELGFEVENFAGSGDFSGTDSAEITLALSSVIELGDKRQARVAVVGAGQRLMEAERQAAALDLMGELTRRYVDVVSTQARLALANKSQSLAKETVESVRRRVGAGAAPKAELLRAQAEYARTEIAVNEEENHQYNARVSLSLLWGESEPNFTRVSGNLLELGEPGDFEELYARAVQNPSIQVFASEERLLDAEYRLAKTQTKSDIGWSIGARQFQETDDTALVASFSVPLFSGKRNRGASAAALAQRDAVFYRRQSAELKLRAQLFDAYQQHKQALTTAKSLETRVIPLLQQALVETQKAYETGRYSYQEWVAARRELITAQYSLIEAANAALSYRTEIEQLSAEPLLASLADIVITE
jgi:cobalt-zinc-cadmium efflux system outer membrane protein